MKRLLLTLALLAGSFAVAVPASAHEGTDHCDPATDAVIVIEYGSLENGEIDVECAPHAVGENGLEALTLAGIEVEQTSSDMPMVCRIDGEPEPRDEKCTETLTGDGYWAFMVAQEGEDWTYAASGLGDHTVEAGQYIALRYQLLSEGENVVVETPATAETAQRAEVPDADDVDEARTDEDDEDFPWTLVISVVALALVAGAAFVLARRRGRER